MTDRPPPPPPPRPLPPMYRDVGVITVPRWIERLFGKGKR